MLNERDMLLDVLTLPIYHSHLYSKLKERLIYTVSRFFIYQKNRDTNYLAYTSVSCRFEID